MKTVSSIFLATEKKIKGAIGRAMNLGRRATAN
jgi:hypothetical protein